MLTLEFRVFGPQVRYMKIFMLSALTLAVTLTGCSDIAPVSESAAARVAEARARNDGPAIWVAKDYDSTLYLFGTVHLLPDDLSWQKEDMRQAFSEAGTVFFEVDTGEAGQLEAAVLTNKLGLRSDGLRLSDKLDNFQLNLLEAASNNGDIPLAALDSMYPWLAAEFLTLSAAQQQGLKPELSADEALKSRAARQGKNVIYLETMESAIRASADLPGFVQAELLTETLENFNTLGPELSRISDAWALGRTEYLTTELIQPMRERSPEIFNALLRDRNKDWVKTLARFMDDSGTGFVAVGTAHLLGEDSLLDELREQGYDVRRYYAFQGDNVINTTDAVILRPEK